MRRRNTRPKRDCQMRHAQKRAMERYDLELDAAGMEDVVCRIRRGDGRFVCDQSLRLSVFDLDMEGAMSCRVVYDRQRKSIVTFLPAPADGDDVPWEHYRG